MLATVFLFLIFTIVVGQTGLPMTIFALINFFIDRFILPIIRPLLVVLLLLFIGNPWKEQLIELLIHLGLDKLWKKFDKFECIERAFRAAVAEFRQCAKEKRKNKCSQPSVVSTPCIQPEKVVKAKSSNQELTPPMPVFEDKSYGSTNAEDCDCSSCNKNSGLTKNGIVRAN